MARSNDFPRVLWLVTSAWLAGCGRLSFDERSDTSQKPLPDAPEADGAAAPPDTAPIGARLDVGPMLRLVTTCGVAPTTSQFVIKNTGDQDLVIEDYILELPTQVLPSATFDVDRTMLPLTITPGNTSLLIVTPPEAVVGSDRGGDLKTATLTIKNNSDEPARTVALEAAVAGANFDVIVPLEATSLAFSGTSGACPARQEVTIKNTGTRAANVSLAASGVGFQGFTSGSVAINVEVTTQVRILTDGDCAASGLSVVYQPGVGVCQAPQLDVSFTISGSASCSCS